MRGHIQQRSPGSYRVAVSAGFDPVTGRRRQVFRTVKGTKRDAERELTKLLREIDSGSFADPGRTTVGEYLEQWLVHVKTRVRSRTFERYEALVRRHLVPTLGAIPLAKLQPLHIQGLYAKALSKGRLDGKGGLSATSVLHIHRVLSEALRQAVRWQMLVGNPAAAVQPPRPERPRLEVVGPEVAEKLLAAARGTSLELPVVLALGTGMRRGELLALRWSEVDLEAGVARVTRSVQETSQGLTFEEPKTDRSRRGVSLPGFVIVALKQHRKEQAERRLLLGEAWADHNLVLDRGDGNPWRPNNLSQSFATFAEKVGYPAVRLHDLRHGHATLMLWKGVHPKVVSERLGHSSIGITLDTYSHVIPSLQAEAASVLDQILGEARGG
jgi:integrase